MVSHCDTTRPRHARRTSKSCVRASRKLRNDTVRESVCGIALGIRRDGLDWLLRGKGGSDVKERVHLRRKREWMCKTLDRELKILLAGKTAWSRQVRWLTHAVALMYLTETTSLGTETCTMRAIVLDIDGLQLYQAPAHNLTARRLERLPLIVLRPSIATCAGSCLLCREFSCAFPTRPGCLIVFGHRISVLFRRETMQSDTRRGTSYHASYLNSNGTRTDHWSCDPAATSFEIVHRNPFITYRPLFSMPRRPSYCYFPPPSGSHAETPDLSWLSYPVLLLDTFYVHLSWPTVRRWPIDPTMRFIQESQGRLTSHIHSSKKRRYPCFEAYFGESCISYYSTTTIH